MCLPHGFVVTDLIAPSQSVPLLVSMLVLCWKPNMVCAQCTFDIYSLPPPWGISSLKSQSIPQVRLSLMFSPFPLPYAYAPYAVSLFFYSIYSPCTYSEYSSVVS